MLFPALPEIIVLSMASLSLLADLFFSAYSPRINYYLSQITLLIVFIISFLLLKEPPTFLFSGMFLLDPISTLLKLFIYLTSFLAFLYARPFSDEKHMPLGEYYTLGLFAVLGMMVMVSAENFLILFLGLEILSLPLYVMIALRRTSSLAAEAAMKYFIMGSFALAILLYGISLLYGVSGSLNILETTQAFSQGLAHPLLFSCALVFIVAGIAFKLGAAPFHVWAPDVYQGAPSIVVLFLGSAPKIAVLGLTFKLLIQTMPGLQQHWQLFLIIISILSMGLGNIVAVAQTNLKRLLAYSSIAHMGYLFLGFIPGNDSGYAAATFYMITYALMTLGGFAMITLLSKTGIEAENIIDFKGLNSRNPWLAFLMLLILLSMAGIPPTVGFFAKLAVLEVLVNAHFIWLAVLALLFAIIGSYYYIAVIKAMYFEAPEELEPLPSISKEISIAMSINGLVMLFLGLFPNGLIELCRQTIHFT